MSGDEREANGERRIAVRWFDPDRTDRSLTFEEALASEPDDRHLLWMDVTGDLRPDEARAVAERFGLDPSSRRSLESGPDRPHLALHGDYVHVRIAAEPDLAHADRTPWLDILAGRNVVISSHEAPVAFLAGLDERIERDTTIGLLDPATFAAAIVDGAVTTYFMAVDAIEDDVDRLDTRSLRSDRERDVLDELVGVRRRIGRLRRLLAGHREVFAGLASADFAHVAAPSGDSDPATRFQAVATRFENAISAVENSRDVLLGSFDLIMTRTAQRTNEIMKVLALATVLLLPGSLIAGLLGMNVEVPLSKDDPRAFWVVILAVGLLAAAIFVVARLRRWL